MGSLSQTLDLEVQVDVRLQKHWDEKLAKSKKNRWPLAPQDLVKLGLVTDENYEAENFSFGDSFAAEQVIEEINLLEPYLKDASLLQAKIVSLGVGLKREWRYVQHANQRAMDFEAQDISAVACTNADEFFAELPATGLGNIMRVCQNDVRELTRSGYIETLDAEMITILGLLNVLALLDTQALMCAVGKFLVRKKYRRVKIITPFPQDNDGRVTWNDHVFAGVEWGDSKNNLHSLKQIVEAAESGSESHLAVLRMKKGKYYHQTWSSFTLKTR